MLLAKDQSDGRETPQQSKADGGCSEGPGDYHDQDLRNYQMFYTTLFFFIDVNPTQIKARTWHFNVVSIMISELNTVDAQSKICVTVYKFF